MRGPDVLFVVFASPVAATGADASPLWALIVTGILLSYMLGIMTLAKRTLAMSPFMLGEAEREEDTGWF